MIILGKPIHRKNHKWIILIILLGVAYAVIRTII
jgi:hypothetical protein